MCKVEDLVKDGSLDKSLALDNWGHEMTTFIPIVLGLGCGKLRHKMAALIHQFKLEVGNCPNILRRYCSSIIGICSDQGVEASLHEAPALDLALHLKNEAEALGASLSLDESLSDTLLPLQPALLDQCGGGPALAHDAPAHDAPRRDGVASDALASLALISKLFPNALFLPGIKHSLDNALHDIWSSMACKERFLEQLRALEVILKNVTYRNKICFLFFSGNTPMDCVMQASLKSWSTSLKSLRWHSVVNFVKELHRVKDGLRKRWNLKRFVSSLPRHDDHLPAEGRGSAPAATYALADQAIGSQFFWSFCGMLVDISSVPEVLSHWSESCCWHGPSGCTERTCAYKGCRAPELAAGAHKYLLNEFQNQASARLGQQLAELSDHDASALLADWHTSLSQLVLQINFKLHFWDLLPWKLAGVACNELSVARVVARECQILWQRMSVGQRQCQHPVTRRFLDPTWRGGDL